MTEGYPQHQYDFPTKRYVQVLDLREATPAMIAEYRKWHSQPYHWSEICTGIRQVGILEMEIYISDNHLVMIVETPADFDWTQAMHRLATLPRQSEWEAFVSRLQGCSPDARSDEKWKMTERMFQLYE